jgi:glycosyltransferase involved in cell wall biosynthesis
VIVVPRGKELWMKPRRTRPIVVNGAFRPQRMTGQQRYATEIADRLVEAGVREVRPSGFWAGSSVRTWLWTLLVLPIRARRAVLISLTARAPVWHPRQVLAVHDLFVLTNPEWYSKSYIRSHVPMLRLQLRTASAVVAVSQPVADQVAASTGAASITLAPNAPSALFLNVGAAEEVFARNGLRRGSFLLAIGSLDPRKNLARLAAAWAAVPEEVRLACPLAIVGGGAAVFAQEAITWPSGTVVTGYVSDADLAGLYEAARAVVFVSLAEGFGLPIVEAAAAGVERFVLSDIDVFHWIAGEGAVYVDPMSESEMTAALQSAVEQVTWPTARIDVRRFAWERSTDAMMEAAERVSRS